MAPRKNQSAPKAASGTKRKKAPDAASCGERACKVEAIVSVDGRGQLVLPKELRERSGIRAGERFALTSWDMNGRLCCITLTRVDELAPQIKAVLGPLMQDIIPEDTNED